MQRAGHSHLPRTGCGWLDQILAATDGPGLLTPSSKPRMRIWNSAWTLLVSPICYWAGNIVLGRGMVGMVPPVTLAYWRWTGAFLIAIGFAWPYLRRDWRVLLGRWRLMLVLSATGIATYNTMSYIGLTSTTALNVLLLQSAGPLIIILWTFALFGDRPSVWQAAGVVLSLIGVAVIAAHGSLESLLHLTVNRGDVWILVAMVIYGVYAALFRVRPATHPLSFLVATMGIGSMMILLVLSTGSRRGRPHRGGMPAWSCPWLEHRRKALRAPVAYLFFTAGSS